VRDLGREPPFSLIKTNVLHFRLLILQKALLSLELHVQTSYLLTYLDHIKYFLTDLRHLMVFLKCYVNLKSRQSLKGIKSLGWTDFFDCSVCKTYTAPPSVLLLNNKNKNKKNNKVDIRAALALRARG
jgi:hypothetical protein